jgi:hypothetical protein
MPSPHLLRCRCGTVCMVAGARIGGSYLHTPFFDVQSGAPLAQRQVLASAEYARLQQQVAQA